MKRALVLVLGVTALAGCAASHATALPAQRAAAQFHATTRGYDAPAGTPLGYAERIAGGRYFAGVVDDPATATMHLNLVHAPQSVIDRLRAAYPDTYVISSNDAPRTWAFVTHLQSSLAWFALKSKGIDVVEDWPTQDGQLVIGVSSSVPAAQAYFDARYGPNVIRVVHAEPGELVTDTRSSG